MTSVIQVQSFVSSRLLVTNVLLVSYAQKANMKFRNGTYIPYTGSTKDFGLPSRHYNMDFVRNQGSFNNTLWRMVSPRHGTIEFFFLKKHYNT